MGEETSKIMFRTERYVLTAIFLLSLMKDSGVRAENIIRVDAMVGYEDTALELAFKETMNKAQQSLLYGNKNLKIEDFFSRVNLEDSYEVSGEVCKVISFGSEVIFGTHSRSSSEYVTSLCNQLSIPNLQIHWDSREVVTSTKRPDRDHMTLNLYPDHHTSAPPNGI